jgi:hypothetical protein
MNDIEAMTLEAIQAELREPSGASVESADAEHRARRQALWARLDVLTKSGVLERGPHVPQLQPARSRRDRRQRPVLLLRAVTISI